MRAFLAAGFQHDYTSTIQLYGWALEILERGRLIWSDVPAEIRGLSRSRILSSKEFVTGEITLI